MINDEYVYSVVLQRPAAEDVAEILAWSGVTATVSVELGRHLLAVVAGETPIQRSLFTDVVGRVSVQIRVFETVMRGHHEIEAHIEGTDLHVVLQLREGAPEILVHGVEGHNPLTRGLAEQLLTLLRLPALADTPIDGVGGTYSDPDIVLLPTAAVPRQPLLLVYSPERLKHSETAAAAREATSAAPYLVEGAQAYVPVTFGVDGVTAIGLDAILRHLQMVQGPGLSAAEAVLGAVAGRSLDATQLTASSLIASGGAARELAFGIEAPETEGWEGAPFVFEHRVSVSTDAWVIVLHYFKRSITLQVAPRNRNSPLSFGDINGLLGLLSFPDLTFDDVQDLPARTVEDGATEGALAFYTTAEPNGTMWPWILFREAFEGDPS